MKYFVLTREKTSKDPLSDAYTAERVMKVLIENGIQVRDFAPSQDNMRYAAWEARQIPENKVNSIKDGLKEFRFGLAGPFEYKDAYKFWETGTA